MAAHAMGRVAGLAIGFAVLWTVLPGGVGISAAEDGVRGSTSRGSIGITVRIPSKAALNRARQLRQMQARSETGSTGCRRGVPEGVTFGAVAGRNGNSTALTLPAGIKETGFRITSSAGPASGAWTLRGSEAGHSAINRIVVTDCPFPGGNAKTIVLPARRGLGGTGSNRPANGIVTLTVTTE